MDLQINPDLIEFMIFWMKSEENEKMSLCDLNYEVVLKFLSNPPSILEKNISNAITENDENEKDEEDDEIVITSDNFNEKVENVLRQIHTHMKNTKQSFIEIFILGQVLYNYSFICFLLSGLILLLALIGSIILCLDFYKIKSDFIFKKLARSSNFISYFK
jgi:hypothetical protein